MSSPTITLNNSPSLSEQSFTENKAKQFFIEFGTAVADSSIWDIFKKKGPSEIISNSEEAATETHSTASEKEEPSESTQPIETTESPDNESAAISSTTNVLNEHDVISHTDSTNASNETLIATNSNSTRSDADIDPTEPRKSTKVTDNQTPTTFWSSFWKQNTKEPSTISDKQPTTTAVSSGLWNLFTKNETPTSTTTTDEKKATPMFPFLSNITFGLGSSDGESILASWFGNDEPEDLVREYYAQLPAPSHLSEYPTKKQLHKSYYARRRYEAIFAKKHKYWQEQALAAEERRVAEEKEIKAQRTETTDDSTSSEDSVCPDKTTTSDCIHFGRRVYYKNDKGEYIETLKVPVIGSEHGKKYEYHTTVLEPELAEIFEEEQRVGKFKKGRTLVEKGTTNTNMTATTPRGAARDVHYDGYCRDHKRPGWRAEQSHYEYNEVDNFVTGVAEVKKDTEKRSSLPEGFTPFRSPRAKTPRKDGTGILNSTSDKQISDSSVVQEPEMDKKELDNLTGVEVDPHHLCRQFIKAKLNNKFTEPKFELENLKGRDFIQHHNDRFLFRDILRVKAHRFESHFRKEKNQEYQSNSPETNTHGLRKIFHRRKDVPISA